MFSLVRPRRFERPTSTSGVPRSIGLTCSVCLLALRHIRWYDALMEYEWDQDKAENNVRKHNVDFADAVTALEDDNALSLEDQDPDEERFITVGMDALGRLLVVTYTWRGTRIRLISARKATRRERNQYEGTSS